MGMEMLFTMIGGSQSYGLNTPESDTDLRGVFINTEPSKILGLERMDHVQKQETDDVVYYELRKFFELLRNGNTGALEILFSEEYLTSSDIFYEIRANKFKFVDTDKMFRCLLGYMQGERRLANGERTGVLGSKRKSQVEKYGFSPKNFTQLFRLANCGMVLFEKGYFPVNMKKYDENVHAFLMRVKTKPESYSKEQLNNFADHYEAQLKLMYENRKFKYTFDSDYANDVLRRAYLPYLQ
jgi:predicted nucleotidyltransferase